MTVTLNLKPEVEAGLLSHARSAGVTPEEYLQQLVEKNLVLESIDSGNGEESGMVWEDGLFIYGRGSALPPGFRRFSRGKIAAYVWQPLLKRFFDTSVLTPAFYNAKHDSSVKAFHAAAREDSFCALRTLGEAYAVLTGLTLRRRITGTDCLAVLRQIREKLTIISLTEDEYVSAIQAVSKTMVGGAAYDALIAQCALKSGADVFLTWNVSDFRKAGIDVAQIVKTPLDI